MDTPDKNAHLSPLLSDIQDYGPGDGNGSERDAELGARTENVSADLSDGPAQSAPAHPDHGGRWRFYGLWALCFITLFGGFGAFVWQQLRVDELRAELHQSRMDSQLASRLAAEDTANLRAALTSLEEDKLALESALAEARSVDPAAPAVAQTSDGNDVTPDETVSQQAMALADPESSAASTAPVSGDSARRAQVSAPVEKPAAVPAPEPAAETTSTPAAPEQSDWYVNVSTVSSRAAAQSWLAEHTDSPENTEVVAIERAGQTLFRIRIGGYSNREEARSAASRFGQQWQIESIWVSED